MVCLSIILNWVAVLALVGVNVIDFFIELGIPKKIVNLVLFILFVIGHVTGHLSFTC